MIEGPVCPVTAVLAAAGIVTALLAATQSTDRPSPARFAGITALVFAAQMMNFPIQDGTSGHLLGGVLASILLGVPFGVLSISAVLVVQCLLFADGGLSALGANIVNMALIGAGLGGWIAVRLRAGKNRWEQAAVTGLAAWGSVVLAALACSFELAMAGTIPFLKVAPAMVGVHALIGIGEATITLAVLAIVPVRARRSTDLRAILVPYGIAFVLAGVLSQFASPLPDGLEWVAKDLGFLKETVTQSFAPFANYSIPWMGGAAGSTGLAGLAGVAITAALAALVASLWTHRLKGQTIS